MSQFYKADFGSLNNNSNAGTLANFALSQGANSTDMANASAPGRKKEFHAAVARAHIRLLKQQIRQGNRTVSSRAENIQMPKGQKRYLRSSS